MKLISAINRINYDFIESLNDNDVINKFEKDIIRTIGAQIKGSRLLKIEHTDLRDADLPFNELEIRVSTVCSDIESYKEILKELRHLRNICPDEVSIQATIDRINKLLLS